jgi:hypothetical protein
MSYRGVESSDIRDNPAVEVEMKVLQPVFNLTKKGPALRT